MPEGSRKIYQQRPPSAAPRLLPEDEAVFASMADKEKEAPVDGAENHPSTTPVIIRGLGEMRRELARTRPEDPSEKEPTRMVRAARAPSTEMGMGSTRPLEAAEQVFTIDEGITKVHPRAATLPTAAEAAGSRSDEAQVHGGRIIAEEKAATQKTAFRPGESPDDSAPIRVTPPESRKASGHETPAEPSAKRDLEDVPQARKGKKATKYDPKAGGREGNPSRSAAGSIEITDNRLTIGGHTPPREIVTPDAVITEEGIIHLANGVTAEIPTINKGVAHSRLKIAGIFLATVLGGLAIAHCATSENGANHQAQGK